MIFSFSHISMMYHISDDSPIYLNHTQLFCITDATNSSRTKIKGRKGCRLQKVKALTTEKEELIYQLLSEEVRKRMRMCRLDPEKLQEIRLRIGRPVFVQYGGKEYVLSRSGSLTGQWESGYLFTESDLKETLSYLSGYSLYAFDEELRQGFFTVSGGHRIGIAGRTVMEHGTISCIRYISFINIRLAHQVRGCADRILPYITDGNEVYSTLLISPPGGGKTTMLRDMIRQVSDGTPYFSGRTVGVVDERSEIAGCWRGIPQNDVGMRTDVLDCCSKAEGMMMLLRSMAPQVLAADEIGTKEDEAALERVYSCGCRLLATAHGTSVDELRKKRLFQQLMDAHVFGRFILLGTAQGRRVCTVYDEAGAALGEVIV